MENAVSILYKKGRGVPREVHMCLYFFIGANRMIRGNKVGTKMETRPF